MDGKGRWVDNVFVERLWKSVKYEEVYLHAYDSVAEARQGLQRYFKPENLPQNSGPPGPRHGKAYSAISSSTMSAGPIPRLTVKPPIACTFIHCHSRGQPKPQKPT